MPLPRLSTLIKEVGLPIVLYGLVEKFGPEATQLDNYVAQALPILYNVLRSRDDLRSRIAQDDKSANIPREGMSIDGHAEAVGNIAGFFDRVRSGAVTAVTYGAAGKVHQLAAPAYAIMTQATNSM